VISEHIRKAERKTDRKNEPKTGGEAKQTNKHANRKMLNSVEIDISHSHHKQGK